MYLFLLLKNENVKNDNETIGNKFKVYNFCLDFFLDL